MTTQELLEKIGEFLETDTKLTPTTEFKSIPEYDSLGTLSLMSLADEYFGQKITAKELDNLVTIQDYIDIIGNDKREL